MAIPADGFHSAAISEPFRYVFEGIHKDSGRLISITVRNDLKYTPRSVFSIVKHMHERSLSEFLECVGGSGPAYAQALGKICGDGSFLKRHNIVSGPSTVLSIDHLKDQYCDPSAPIAFEIMHKDELDHCMSKMDELYFVSMEGAPYFIGDFNKTQPTGVLEPAATVKVRDIIWLDEDHVIAGPEYFWHDQYLINIRTIREGKSRGTIQRILYDRPVSHVLANMGDCVDYRCSGRKVDILALEVISSPTHEVYIAGAGRHVVRRGMGAVFDLPIWMRHAANLSTMHMLPVSFLDRIYGCITGFKKSSDPRAPVMITIAVHLDKDNIPAWLLSKVNDSHLLQTNLELTVSEAFLMGVFSIWPASLFQGDCVPGRSGRDQHINSRVVIGHINFRMKEMGPDLGEAIFGSSSQGVEEDAPDRDSDSGSITSPVCYPVGDCGRMRLFPQVKNAVDPLVAMHEGRAFLEVLILNPLRTSSVLDCLHHQDQLFYQVTYPGDADCQACPAVFDRH
jgi:hypothetical protein